MDLFEFEKQLKKRLISIENPRPFICDGNPLESRIFIVGFNAATEMDAQFWDFWTVDSGFNKQSWFDAYVQERISKPLEPGKKRRNRVSNTRQRIEWIINEITDVKCLETNIYMTPTAKAKELKKNQKDSSIFDFLLKTIKPKIILTHGVKPKRHLESLIDSELIWNHFNTASLSGTQSKIYPVSHLAIGWSKQKSLELGKLLQKEISEN